jgi:tetratricopeptide (TPR) repeat protein
MSFGKPAAVGKPAPGSLIESGEEDLRFIWIITLLVVPGISHALTQAASGYVSNDAVCAQLNETVVAQVAKGQFVLAESILSKATASGLDRAGDNCAGFILNNMAAMLSIQGRIAEAERYAERSVRILETKYPPTGLALLRPFSILASARFEQGKIAGAREAFRKMESIRSESPADRALVHATGAVLLHAEGRLAEAESEYLLTFEAWEEAGHGDTADAGAVFSSLGALYIARQGAWRESEQKLSEALSIADREP